MLWRGRDEADEARRIDGFYRLCMALPSDFASLAMIDAMSGNRRGGEAAAAGKLFRHPRYKEWAEKHGKELKKRISF